MSSVLGDQSLEIVSRRLQVRLVVVLVALLTVTTAFFITAVPVRGAPPSVALPTALPDYMRFIQVNNYKFDPLVRMPSIPAALLYTSTDVQGQAYYIVQFNGVVTDSMKAGLASTGAVVLSYINYNAFIVRASPSTMARVQGLATVRWAGVFEPAYKLSPTLSDAYVQMAESAMQQELNGGAVGGVVSTIGGAGGAAAKSVTVDSAGRPISASTTNVATTAGASASASPSSGGANSMLSAANPTVAAATQNSIGTYTSNRITVTVLTFETAWVPGATVAVAALGGSNTLYNFNLDGWGTIQTEISKDAIPMLARVPGVMWIDRNFRPYVFNDIARWVIQSGNSTSFATPVHNHGIYGTNQTVTLGDSGVDWNHPDFKDPNVTIPGPTHRKVTAYYDPPCPPGGCDLTDNGINHGTHTSGSLVGDAGTWHVYDGNPTGSNGTSGPHDGQAFDAKENMQDLSADGLFINFNNVNDLWSLAVNHSSWIHSDSWGSCCSAYIADSATTDAFVWSNVNFTIVFAAANAGPGLGTMNPYGGAKNVIAVGATGNGVGENDVASFSSRGPMADGRLKPDVMAPGVGLWSAKGACPSPCNGTTWWQLSGTSMATPTTAGGATLIRQYYMDGWYPSGMKTPADGFTPTAALIKATLINSAVEMTGSGAYANGQNYYPNDNQGWGRILLDNALYFSGDTRNTVLDDHRAGLSTGNYTNYSFAVADPSQPVKVTLVWSDYPGNPATTPNLVNDLDLVVTAPDGTIYRGNVFAGQNPGQSVPNPSVNLTDHLNNVENVLVISNVQVGSWKVSIHAFNVPHGPQPFALVMTGGFATNRGTISLDKGHYKSSALVHVQVIDTGPNVNPNAPDTLTVNMSSTTEAGPVVITLTETGNNTSVFDGTIQLVNGTSAPPGELAVVNGDTITADYFDVNNGMNQSVHVLATAIVDDVPPVISAVVVTGLHFNRATIGWTTDEPATSVLVWDNVTPPVAHNVTESALVTTHAISLKGLTQNTTYYFYVQSTDEAGNPSTDNNGSAYFHFTTPLMPPTAAPSYDWPTFHNNQARLGVSPRAFSPPLTEAWTAGPYDLQFWNGPVFADGILFTDPLDGTLRARDPYTGAILWTRHLGDQNYYTGTMVVQNGVLFGTWYGARGGFVYALDETTGNTIWVDNSSTGLDFNARVSMAAADGLVFGSAWGGEIYALHQSNGTVAWKYQTGESYPFGGPTVSGGLVFQGTTSNDLFALDEFSGALIWKATLDGPITSVPLYAGGVVYVGTNGGTMFALDAFSGAVIWSTSAFGYIDFSTPSYDGTNLYFGSFGNDAFYAVDAATGAIVWTTPITAPVGTTVAYAHGFVYANAWDGIFRVMNATTGAVVETHSLKAFASTSAPAISDGWIWFEDYFGNIYGFSGQLQVGFTLSPSTQSMDTVPNSMVNYSVKVTNVGVSGNDTFDVNVTLGSHGWAVALFKADGTTPLPDTNGDGTPDTGSLATGANTTIIARVTVPASVSPGDSETSRLVINSVKDHTFVKEAKLTTIVPPPGVAVGPRRYINPHAGDLVSTQLKIYNLGGFPDTIDVTAVSSHGWNVSLYEADGITPLPDTNGDGIPDTGLLPGLTYATITVKIQVPAGTPLGTLDKVVVTGNSTLAPTVKGKGTIVLELVLPPDEQWPTFHNNNPRHGESPSIMAPPLTQLWTAGPYTEELWTSPIIGDGILFSTTLDGFIRARDPYSGAILWSRQLGGTYYYTGTPTVANGIVYATFDTGSMSGVYALDEYTGNTIWADTGGSPYYNARIAMAYADNMVFGTTWSGDVFALNATTGAQVWDYNTGGVELPFGGPTVNGGLLYFGGINGNEYALNEMTGAVVWQRMLDGSVTSVPLVAQGTVFVGTYGGTMWALDGQTGATIWSTGGFNLIDFSTPSYNGLAVFFGDFNNQYVALDVGTGAVLWTTSTFGPVGSSTAYANGFVYGTAWDGHLRVMNATTGAIVDDHKLAAFASTSSPAISRGWVWVEDLNGELYGFGAPGAGVVRGVQVLPGSADIQVGQAALFRATGVDAFGNRIPVKDADWLPLQGLGYVLKVSNDTALYVAGILAGNDTLQATSQGIAGNATVHVLPGPLDRIEVYMLDPQGHRVDGPVSIEAGAQGTFRAAATDRFGNPITGATFTWAVAGGIGTIDSAGVFTASTTVGTGYVTATYGGRTGQQLVTIVPGAPASVNIALTSTSVEVDSSTLIVGTVVDAYGNAIPDGILTWATTGGSILSLTPDGRSILYHAPITTTPASVQLTATIGSLTRTITLTIVAGPTELIQVAMLVGGSPTTDPVSIPAGSHQTFVAAATDRFGNPIVGATFVWGATGGIGTIDSAGGFTASTTPGTGFVSATQGGRTGRQTVTIVAAAPATLAIELPSTSLMVDSQSLVVASVLDVYGNSNLAGVVRWTTTGTGTVLALTPDGRSILYHAPITTTPASAQLTATIGNVTQTITLTIVAGPPVGITIDAPATTVAVGGTLAFGSVVTDQFGNAVTGATIAWTSTAGTINQQGVFTAPSSPGLVVITASTAGRASFVVIDVTSGGFEQFTREATSATSLALLVVAVIAVAACVFLFVRYRGMRRELDDLRKGGQGGGGGGVA